MADSVRAIEQTAVPIISLVAVASDFVPQITSSKGRGLFVTSATATAAATAAAVAPAAATAAAPAVPAAAVTESAADVVAQHVRIVAVVLVVPGARAVRHLPRCLSSICASPH
jgi:hypothetical protein